MAKAYLLTNEGSGGAGDEWLLKSIHATKEGADAAKTDWYRSVEDWEIEGSLLTESEREAIEQAIDAVNGMEDAEPWTADALRGLLDRLA